MGHPQTKLQYEQKVFWNTLKIINKKKQENIKNKQEKEIIRKIRKKNIQEKRKKKQKKK